MGCWDHVGEPPSAFLAVARASGDRVFAARSQGAAEKNHVQEFADSSKNLKDKARQPFYDPGLKRAETERVSRLSRRIQGGLR